MDNFYALIFGINNYKESTNLRSLKYASKDAQDVFEALINPKIGNHSKENILLFLDEAATTDVIEESLYTHVVKKRKPEDTVLVYFSGHGFIAGDSQKAYLATYDVAILKLLNNPRSGLQMDYLHDDIFMATKANNVIFILDCCHSGAFAPNVKGHNDTNLTTKEIVDNRFFQSGKGRIAFVSSPRGIESRESNELKNGIFTSLLLEGLKGAATESITNEVTLDSLASYVRARAPSNQPPVRYGQDVGRIVLAKPTMQQVNQHNQRFRTLSLTASAGQEKVLFPLGNPLENSIGFINQLLDIINAFDESTETNAGNRTLSALRRAVNASLIFVQRVTLEGTITTAISDYDYKIHPNELIDNSLIELQSILSKNKYDLLATRYGIYSPHDTSKGDNKYDLVIPLHLWDPKDFLIVCGITEETIKFGESLGRVLLSVYNATQELTNFEPLNIESKIFDDLKQAYGYLPYEIYKRRFELFKKRLSNVIFHFEPILRIRKHDPYIVSWEALARESTSGRTPIELFSAAELWGREFITELDLYTVQTAIKKYSLAAKEFSKSAHIKDISVNVYPETLLRTKYYNQLKDILKEQELISPENLILEISEKHPIPNPDKEDIGDGTNSVDYFKEKLEKFSRDLNIGFAIDDFGVGYSSISRLIQLNLAYVKIDREILQHQYAAYTIEYVKGLVRLGRTHHTKVVVEGFDSDSKISLSELHRIDIDYVQGYIVGKADSSLHDLSPETKEYLSKLITGSPINTAN